MSFEVQGIGRKAKGAWFRVKQLIADSSSLIIKIP